jgi:hypothetical protein
VHLLGDCVILRRNFAAIINSGGHGRTTTISQEVGQLL